MGNCSRSFAVKAATPDVVQKQDERPRLVAGTNGNPPEIDRFCAPHGLRFSYAVRSKKMRVALSCSARSC